MAFVEDFREYLKVEEFAAPAMLAGAQVRGIFDNAYRQGEVGYNGMASTQPVFLVATSDVPANPVGASLVVNATSYLIASVEPDGTGMSQLFLELA